MLLLGGECKPSMTPPPLHPPGPHLGGDNRPVALETHKTRKSDSSSHVPLTRNFPLHQRPRRVSHLFPPRSSPTQSPSPREIGATCWCFFFVGGGRREGYPRGTPPFPEAPLLRWCTSLLGSPTSHCPPGAIPGCIPLVPKYRKP